MIRCEVYFVVLGKDNEKSQAHQCHGRTFWYKIKTFLLSSIRKILYCRKCVKRQIAIDRDETLPPEFEPYSGLSGDLGLGCCCIPRQLRMV